VVPIATLFLVSSTIAMYSPLVNVKGGGPFSKSPISNLALVLGIVLSSRPYLVLTESENTSGPGWQVRSGPTAMPDAAGSEGGHRPLNWIA
jgi:hypothetical protein